MGKKWIKKKPEVVVMGQTQALFSEPELRMYSIHISAC